MTQLGRYLIASPLLASDIFNVHLNHDELHSQLDPAKLRVFEPGSSDSATRDLRDSYRICHLA